MALGPDERMVSRSESGRAYELSGRPLCPAGETSPASRYAGPLRQGGSQVLSSERLPFPSELLGSLGAVLGLPNRAGKQPPRQGRVDVL